MQFKDILYEVKGDYAHVTINRPKVLNAFTPVTLQELKTALDAAEKDKEVGVIVLSGAGDRAFCSGGDMNWESSKEFQDHEYEFHIHLTKCSKPIIAKVDGYAIGGGNHMAYFCDLTIASENSIFGQNGPQSWFSSRRSYRCPLCKYFRTQTCKRNVDDLQKILSKRDDELGFGKFSSEER